MKFKKLGKAGLRTFSATACGLGSAMLINAAAKAPLPPEAKILFFTMGTGMAVGAAMLGADAASDTVQAFRDDDE